MHSCLSLPITKQLNNNINIPTRSLFTVLWLAKCLIIKSYKLFVVPDFSVNDVDKTNKTMSTYKISFL